MSHIAIYNARNTPPSPNLENVAHDFEQAIKNAGMIGINEAYSKKYKRTLERVAHKNKRLIIWGKGGVGLCFRASKWSCRKWKWTRYHRGVLHFTPERGVLTVTLWNKFSKRLETYYITHMINGGFNDKPLVFKWRRAPMWKRAWAVLQWEVSTGGGLRAVLGDINRPARDTPPPNRLARLHTPDYEIMQIWLIGGWEYRESWNVPESKLRWTDHRIYVIRTHEEKVA